MNRILEIILFTGICAYQTQAGTVIVTSVADPEHAQAPLTSAAGVSLTSNTQVRLGAFPSMTDDQILDLASEGGLIGIEEAFVPFGNQHTIGQGVGGAAGGFEIAAKAPVGSTPLSGQTVAILIRTAAGEFLVSRFPGKVFENESATGLEPLLTLHLAEAKVIVGSRLDSTRIATSAAPSVGSFSTWLSGFPAITDPLMKLPQADPDFDGRSNFLEYATGGNPIASGDPAPCMIRKGTDGELWVNFQRVSGLGMVRYSLESSDNLSPPWLEFSGNLETDPESPQSVRAPLPGQPSGNRFFRLKVEEHP